MKKLILLTVLCCGVLFTACGADTYIHEELPQDSITYEIPSEEANPSEIPAVIPLEFSSTQPSNIPARGANDFAFRLGAALAGDIGDYSFVVSPYSVWLPLAALVNATSEEHLPELLEALGMAGISAQDINAATARMLDDLTRERFREQSEQWGEEHHNPLAIANAIFVDYQHQLQTNFAEIFAEYFMGTAMNVDFSCPSAVEIVNQWASDNTEGLITDIIQEFDPYTIAAIANAIYFSDRWHYFNKENTAPGVFHAASGAEMTAYFMEYNANLASHFEDDRIQAIRLGFVGGGSMYILLPHDGDAAQLFADMTAEYFSQIQSESRLAEGRLLLPRFSIDSEIDNLRDALIALGVPLFCQTGPLDGLVYYSWPAFLDEAIQVATIDVNEEGTTAAAVTILTAMPVSMPPPPFRTFEMICDRPFMFILTQWTQAGGQQVLFTGVVNEVS